ncbi:Potassium transporter 5 [Castilleja foliolosa]|uniref:Potassium transporter 5 n=1 Tax=Castilleja foliolosa TaxID=1961234 RepID=A0ABD3D822_9LAMI
MKSYIDPQIAVSKLLPSQPGGLSSGSDWYLLAQCLQSPLESLEGRNFCIVLSDLSVHESEFYHKRSTRMDTQLSNYKLDRPSDNLHHSQKIKEKLENSKTAKLILFISTILGTSMVIGDGILTPCISVLSAVSGIKHLNQRFGTSKIGFSYAPLICVWLLFISGIGLYNFCKHDMSVLRAFNPRYIVHYFQRNGKKGWISLGGSFSASLIRVPNP